MESTTATTIVPMHVVNAVQHGNLEIFTEYLNSYPIHMPLPVIDAENCSLVHWAAINNRIDFILILLERGADINYIGGILNENPLQWAVRNHLHISLVHIMLNKGADHMHVSNMKLDALQIACRSGNVKIAYLLLISNAKVDIPDEKGDTALLWLIKNFEQENCLDLVRLLLRFGADLLIEDAEGYNCIHILCLTKRKKVPKRLLTLITKYGGIEIRSKCCKSGILPMDLCGSSGNYEMMQYIGFDLFIYHFLPRKTPIFIHALGIIGLFLSCHYYGWLGLGIAFPTILFFIAKCDIYYIEIGDSKSIHGKVYGLITGLAIIFYLYIFQSITIFSKILLIMSIYMIYYTLYTTSITKPSRIISQDTHELVASITSLPTNIELKICTTCLIDRQLVSMHCSSCDQCVEDLDHHCPFVNTCVGPRNRRIFVFFTFFASFTCLILFLLAFQVKHLPKCLELQSFLSTQMCHAHDYPVFFISTWLYIIVSFWTAMLFLTQVSFVMAETSTYEDIKSRTSTLIPRRLALNPKKAWMNFFVFLWTGKSIITKVTPEELSAMSCTNRVSGGSGSCENHNHDHSHGGHHDHSTHHTKLLEQDVESGHQMSNDIIGGVNGGINGGSDQYTIIKL